jgi:hypothetical protein
MTSAKASETLREEELESNTSDVIVQKQVKRTWQSHIWDTFDKSPEERKFLFKLDAALLTFASLGSSTHHVLWHLLTVQRLFHKIS